MIKFKEVIEASREHLSAQDPRAPRVAKDWGGGKWWGLWDRREIKQIHEAPKWDGEQHLIHKGRQTAEAWAWPGDRAAGNSHIHPGVLTRQCPGNRAQ